jgi:hypothetical protein
MVLFIKLLIAHLIGDFFLQSSSAVKQKEIEKVKSPYLYIHCVVHAILSLLVSWDIHFWPYALFIGGAHLLIDTAKLYIQSNKWKLEIFLVDQTLHILVLFVVSLLNKGLYFQFSWLFETKAILLYVALLLLTTPSSILIKMAISNWSPQHYEERKVNDSLQNAGKWIGNLERLLIFIFIIIGRFEAVGFLLAAKSIFRFGDLKQGEDRRLTEYVLIGTLLSFGIAILISILYEISIKSMV